MTSISHKLTDSINATNVTKIQIGLLVEDNQQLETKEKKNERKITTITEIQWKQENIKCFSYYLSLVKLFIPSFPAAMLNEMATMTTGRPTNRENEE